MCGINGFVRMKYVDDSKYRINMMNKSLKHRGPDANGFVILQGGHIALGHRRLSIIDLDSRSNQPMYSASKRCVMVFNGEIYNHKELKSTLPYGFTTTSDTEVLLAGLENQGIDWIKKCNGMFAVALYDNRDDSLMLIRDRFGIKPLYYYKDDENFVFSSEIKGILNSGLVEAIFNVAAIDEYLGNRYVRAPYTFFKNIFQVPPGHYLKLDKNMNMSISCYWSLTNQFNRNTFFSEEDIFNEFSEKVKSAIQRRMISDVPLGAYLSGGIDSSLISAIIAQKTSGKINTYTIGFSELNEFLYARKVADKYGTEHHEILIDENDYLGKMNEIISYKDSPLGVPNEIPLAIMSKELKKDITVVLSGEGADELMGGYGRIFRASFDFENRNESKSLCFYDFFVDLYEYVPRCIRDKYLTTPHPIRDYFDKLITKEFKTYKNDENVFRFFHNYHIQGLLQRVDITTMYASVEARVPFLDHDLVEFVYKKVPYDLKLKWKSNNAKIEASVKSASEYSEILDSPKYLLKKMGLEYLPKEVVLRKKMGFPVPLNDWISKICTMANILLNGVNWLQADRLDELIIDCKKNSKSGQLLWMFLNVELFRQLYFEVEWRY